MMRHFGVWLLALGGLGGAAGLAEAGHCGASRYPRGCVCPDQCTPAVVPGCVQYQEVIERQEQVCYRPVYKTVYQPETYTTCKTVHETNYCAQKYTVNR